MACVPQRILLIRPSALGDVCRTVPILASLRAAYPNAQIDWMVRDSYVDAVVAHPALSEVVPFPRRRFARVLIDRTVRREFLQWLRALRRREYDLVLDCQGLGRSGLFALLSGAPRRVGPADARELGWLGYTVRHRIPRNAEHTVERMLALLRAEGIAVVEDMRLYVPPEAGAWWRGRLPPARYGVIAPTARWASKCWPMDRWVMLAQWLAEERGLPVAIIGAPGEESQVAPLLAAVREENGARIPGGDLVGKTSVGQMMAVIRDAALVVANDSAPLHMAVGLDRPCVALFGPTDPRLVGPWKRPGAVVQPTMSPDRSPGAYRDRAQSDAWIAGITLDAVKRCVDAQLAAPAPLNLAREAQGDCGE